MLFNDQALQKTLTLWRQTTDALQHSTADNMWFEERVSPVRQETFEEAAMGAGYPDELRRFQTDYWNEFVRVDHDIPHTFLQALAPADLGNLDEAQKIIRVESLTRPLAKAALSFEQLKAAVDKDDRAVVARLLYVWNNSNIRDWRPSFAAFKDELLDILVGDSWPCMMRDRLGLAHYDCAAGPIPIALMEYSVAEIKVAASRQTGACAITAPTVLDSAPWPYFFPAPRELVCGRTMPLFTIDDENELLAEILHFRIVYRPEHLMRLGEIKNPPAALDLKTLRNHHLLAVQAASGRDDFGEEIA